MKTLLGHFLVVKHSPCPCGGSANIPDVESSVGVDVHKGWEKVLHDRDGSYSEFLGAQSNKERGQGLLVEMAQRGFSAARVLLSVCIPVFIATEISSVCNSANIVKACPFREQQLGVTDPLC